MRREPTHVNEGEETTEPGAPHSATASPTTDEDASPHFSTSALSTRRSVYVLLRQIVGTKAAKIVTALVVVAASIIFALAQAKAI